MRVIVNGKKYEDAFCAQQMMRVSQEMPGISEEDAKKEVANNIIMHELLDEYSQKEIGAIPAKRVNARLDELKASFPDEIAFQQMCMQQQINEEIIYRDIESDMRINAFVAKLTKDIPPPPRKIIEQYYEKDYYAGTKPQEIHAAHIVKEFIPQTARKVYNEMLAIRKQLLDGADFAKIAEAHSSCTEKGGDLGFFARGKMVEEFDVIAFSMMEGEISPIFQTPFGYHIVKVIEIKPEERLSLAECKDKIVQAIKEKMTKERVDKWLEKAKKKANIVIEK